MLSFLEPYMIWIRILVIVGAFAAGCWATHRYYLGEEAQRNLAALDATHKGWVQATERWKAKDASRIKTDTTNDNLIATLRAQVRALNEEIDHAPLVSVAEAARECPDPRGAEWLRLYNRAADPTAGSVPADPSSVPP